MSPKGRDDLVLMGRVGAAHGIKGEVRIQSYCAAPLDIAAYGPLETERFGALTLLAARMQKSMVIARIAGITDRTAAERLTGTGLFIRRDRLPPVGDDDDFYIADLIGLEARLKDGTAFGTVHHIEDYGAGDIIEIARPDGTSRLIPFTRQVVPEIHLAQGYLIVVPPPEVELGEGGPA